jgi:hypothetical protein
MGKYWLTILGLTIALCGCTTTNNQFARPTPPKPEYLLPPDERRFIEPPSFPENTLTSGQPKKPDAAMQMGPPGPGGMGGPSARFGGGPGGMTSPSAMGRY